MPVKITVKDNGSIRVEGDFELCDASGKKFDLAGRTSISLCRCAASANKPFCDGAHATCGFQSKIVATSLPAQPSKA